MEQQLKRIWQGKSWQVHCLWPLSVLFKAVVCIRRWLYRRGWLESYPLNVPVVVIGNITVGGTGKTPLVSFVANWLQSQGKKVGIISRGYGGAATEPTAVTAASNSRLVGDEAVLLAGLTDCPIAVGQDRVATAELLLKSHPDLDVLLSDDGLQHYRLRRDIEVVLVDGDKLFGNKLCLPAGPLREPLSRLAGVDMVVSKGASTFTDYYFELIPEAVRSLVSGTTSEVSSWQGKRVHAVAGIGHPEAFFLSLERLGMQVERHIFPDHHDYQASDFAFTQDTPLMPVIMTSKDAVKCDEFAAPNWYQLDVRVQLSRTLQQRLRELLEV